jgi:hypothetical protein
VRDAQVPRRRVLIACGLGPAVAITAESFLGQFRRRARILFVFTRVRRGDLVLATIALLGLVAGLVLTIGTKIGAPGPILIAVGIVAALAAATTGIRDQVTAVIGRQHQQHERLEAILAIPIEALGDVDPFRIGVFPSTLAESAQLNPPVPGTRDHSAPQQIPPYVARGIDEGLRRALTEPALEQTCRLVVLRGDPKSGKSRTLWEAIHALPSRKLLAVTQPDQASDSSEPAFAPLATLASLDRPVSGSKGRDLVIWVDDAHTHLRRGLTRENLRQLRERYPAVIIALTIHGGDLDALQTRDRPLYDLLGRPFDDLILTPTLSPVELTNAKAAYPGLARQEHLVRLPELFAAVNLLTDRYRHHRTDQPAGVAVAKAAIDWQRAGMPPGSIDKPTLRALTKLTLEEITPNRVLDDEMFERGLAWSTNEVAAYAALVLRDPVGESEVERFRAFDGVVSWAGGNEPSIRPAIWDFVLARASDLDRLGVGFAASEATEWGKATEAFQRSASSADSKIAAPAGVNLGIAHYELGSFDEAVAVYDQVLDRFGDATDPALREQVATALLYKGAALGQLSRPGENGGQQPE